MPEVTSRLERKGKACVAAIREIAVAIERVIEKRMIEDLIDDDGSGYASMSAFLYSIESI